MLVTPDTQQFLQCQMHADYEHSRRVGHYGHLLGRKQKIVTQLLLKQNAHFYY
jgi:hypothetical protein